MSTHRIKTFSTTHAAKLQQSLHNESFDRQHSSSSQTSLSTMTTRDTDNQDGSPHCYRNELIRNSSQPQPQQKIQTISVLQPQSSNLEVIFSSQHQRQLRALQSWSVYWGAYCRRTATKENQDGWFVLRSSLKVSMKNEEKLESKNIHGSKPNHWGCWYEMQQLQPNTHASTAQSPFQSTLSELNNRIMAINLDCLSSPPTSSLSITASRGLGGTPANEIPTTPSRPHPLWSLTCRRPWVFGVLDGHGSGGRLASHEASKILTSCIEERLNLEHCQNSNLLAINSEDVTNCHKSEVKQRLCQLRDILLYAFSLAQEKLLESNTAASRDFGTTAVATACMGRYLITATCGDSSAILVVASKNSQTTDVIINVQFNYFVRSVDHTLLSTAERQRISAEGKGRIVIGDGGVHRLIPGFFSYEQAKVKGLSINMARALGHFLLSKCSLSPKPQFTLVDLSDIFQTLLDLHRNPPYEQHSYLFEAREFEATLEQKFKRTTNHSTTTTTTGTASSTGSGPLKMDEGQLESGKEAEFGEELQDNYTHVTMTNEKQADDMGSGSGNQTAREDIVEDAVVAESRTFFSNQNVSQAFDRSKNTSNRGNHRISDSSSDNDVVIILDDERSPISFSGKPNIANPQESSTAPIVEKHLSPMCLPPSISEILQSPYWATSPAGNRETPSFNKDALCASPLIEKPIPSNGITSMVSGMKNRRDILEYIVPSNVTTSWGVRTRDAILDWLSPDDDQNDSLVNDSDVTRTSISGKLEKEEQNPIANGTVNSDTFQNTTLLEETGSENNSCKTIGTGADVNKMASPVCGNMSPLQPSKSSENMTFDGDDDEEDDEWCRRDREPSMSLSTSQLIEQSTTLLILMSDGVSDVLSRGQVGELAILLDNSGSSPEQISEFLTLRASHIRRQRGFRADNCTCVVAKLKPCLSD